jgi:hypothetical protein
MPRKTQPRKSRQASKLRREQRTFWHSLGLAVADGILSAEEVVR